MKKYIWLLTFFMIVGYAGAQTRITAWEYWFDNNYSLVVNQTTGATNVLSLNQTIDVSSLNYGLHNVHFRFKDERGIWSPIVSRFFTWYPGSGTPELKEITAVEYWYDNDYSAVVFENITASSDFNLDKSLDVSALNYGLHNVHFRFKDERGIWSPIVSRFFTWYPGSGTPELKEITVVEYWYDNDYSAVVSENITASSNFNLDKSLDVSALNYGLHNVHFRFKDERGIWSPIVSRFFTWYPGSGTPELQEITAFEFWFNEDYSSVISQNISATGTLNLDETLDVSALKNGLHTLHYRVKDKRGFWGTAGSKFFVKYEPAITYPDNKIVGYRYWADDNIESAKEVTLTTPVKLLVLDELIDISHFPSGEHVASFQFLDEQGNWSSAISQASSKAVEPYVVVSASDSTVCANSTISFYAEIADADAIEWDFGDGTTSNEFSPVHSYDAEGNYPVSAIVTHTDSLKTAKDTIEGGITVYPAYSVSEPVENIEVTLGVGICSTEISYPDFIESICATFVQTAGIGQGGTFPIGTSIETWSVTNSSGETAEISFEVIVISENDLPGISPIADIEVNEDAAVNVDLAGITFGTDCNPQDITVTTANINSNLVSNIGVTYNSPDGTGALDITLVPNANGVDTITVTINDSEGGSMSEKFELRVKPVNDAPFLVNPVPDGIVNAAKEIVIPISTILGELFDDVDDDILKINVVLAGTDTIPNWAAFDTDTINVNPMIVDTGSYSFVVTATDTSLLVATDTFVLVVEGYLTGINDFDAGLFQVNMYPNPTKGEVIVKINASEIRDSEVAVMSITGSEVYRKKYRATDLINLDLSEYVNGMYIIKLQMGNESVTRKLILNKN